ncbi:MAG: O-antigen ligase family protein [Verrucomicrobia bacterium]|nr:O-antigen ligase family protein [Verrucomicrobiota bacterium]
MAADHTFEASRRSRRPALTPREISVIGLTAAILVLVPWTWGGVVLWPMLLLLGLAVAVLVAAVGNHRTQCYALGVWVLALGYTWLRLPNPADGFSALTAIDYWAFPLGGLVGQTLPAILFYGDLRSRPAKDCLRDWVTSVPFWVVVALFTYCAVQALNPWGTVVEKDLFWRIFREKPVAWLPSGLAAPFVSDESDPGGMNAWRLMLTLLGPWLVFGALRAGLRRRHGLVILAWISIAVAVIYAVYGFLNQRGYTEAILGYPVPVGATTFGTFINRNHAGIYFYLNAAVAVALTFWHLRRTQASVARGGPYLLAAFCAAFLGLFVFFTTSIGAAIMVLLLLAVVTPLAYFLGTPKDAQASRDVVWVSVTGLSVVFLAFLFAGDFRSLEKKIQLKAANYQVNGSDDRAPLRRSTWAMASAGGWSGKIWTGWGAGSYRWVSPVFQADEKPLQDANGKLAIRATYAHCDWLQMLAEWGVLGMLPVLAGLWWLGRWIRRACRRGHPEAIPLAGVLILVCLHATVELIFWFTPLLYALALIIAAMVTFTEHDLRTQADLGHVEGE